MTVSGIGDTEGKKYNTVEECLLRQKSVYSVMQNITMNYFVNRLFFDSARQ